MTNTLQGLRLLNTRPYPQSQPLSQALREAGGIVIECPALAIETLNTDWLFTLPDLSTIDQAIFISANAAHHSIPKIIQQNINWPTSIQVIAIGKGTAQAINQYGLTVHLIPEQSNSEQLLAQTELQMITNQKILLFKGHGGRTLIADTLFKRGAKLTSLDVYQRVPPQLDHKYLRSLWRDDAVDIILWTSEQAMQTLFALFGKPAQTWLRQKPCLVLSERLKVAASSLGIETIIISQPEEIVTTLEQSHMLIRKV
jgi:uroporphyrinogen-III synthase